MSDQAKWGIGLMVTLLLAVTTATWVIDTSIGDVRERLTAVEVQLREVQGDVTWLRNNYTGDR